MRNENFRIVFRQSIFSLILSYATSPPIFHTRTCFRTWNSTWRNYVSHKYLHRRTRVAWRIARSWRKFACSGDFGFFENLQSGRRRVAPCHFSKHFSNASTSGIREQHLYIRCSPRRGIPSSHESLASKHVFRIRVSLRHAASVCSRASTRGHAKEIACHSSIEGPTVLSFSRLLLSLSSSLHSPC